MSAPEEMPVIARLGEQGVRDIVAAFYRRVAVDDLLRPLYPEADLAAAEERLADFLVYRFGGSQRYLEQRGHPKLRMRHMPFAIDRAARDRWMELMREAIAERGVPEDVRHWLDEFLGGVATFLINSN